MNGTRCALDGCSFRYASDESADGVERGVHAIDHVSLQARAGEVVMLVGRSGCGKTTVTRLLNGLAPEYFRGSLHGEAAWVDSTPAWRRWRTMRPKWGRCSRIRKHSISMRTRLTNSRSPARTQAWSPARSAVAFVNGCVR
mgnify:CR=1 FL=1